MLALDHLMFEVDDPQTSFAGFAEIFGLPAAWPYTPGPDYDSLGANLGGCNVEFIRFRRRFGQAVSAQPNGLGGVAFRVEGELPRTLELLRGRGIAFEDGEDIPAHTTLVLGPRSEVPTPFLVKYKFDTAGWHARLRSEFAACSGGTLRLEPQAELVLGKPFLPLRGLLADCRFDASLGSIEVRLVSGRASRPEPLLFLGVPFVFA